MQTGRYISFTYKPLLNSTKSAGRNQSAGTKSGERQTTITWTTVIQNL